jgi:hypothetical protein
MLQVGRQHGQGLVGPTLAFPQTAHGCLVASVAQQMIAAHAFRRDDGPGAQGGHASGQGRLVAADIVLAGPAENQARAADGASQRLGVIAAIQGVFVLRAALGTERKAGHGGIRPVIGQGVDDRVTRPALGAVDERIAVAAFGGVLQLGQAIVADEMIRRDMHMGAVIGFAGFDDEGLETLELRRTDARRIGLRQGRRAFRNGAREGGQIFRRAFQMDFHLAAPVAHPASQLQFVRETRDEGAESHALHSTGDGDAR